METKEKVREQLKEMDFLELCDIMNLFFRTDSFSWQARILSDVVNENPNVLSLASNIAVGEIIDKVSIHELVRYGCIENPFQDIIDEFLDIKSSIESMSYEDVMNNYCTLGESDNEIELDVEDDGDSLIKAVYIDVNKDGSVVVCCDNITIKGDGKEEVINLSRFFEE